MTGSASPVQRRLVDDRLRVRDDSVRGNDLARAHDHEVAGHERFDRDLLDARGTVAMGDARRALDQKPQLAAGPARRPGLEGRAAGQHQRDDRAGELLAEDQRARDRDERDRVDADIPSREAADRVEYQRDEDDRGAETPGRVRPAGLVEQPEDAARDDGCERDDRERARSHVVGRSCGDGDTRRPVAAPRREPRGVIVPVGGRLGTGTVRRRPRLHPRIHPLRNGSLERGTEESAP